MTDHAEIRAALEAVTPGPWTADEYVDIDLDGSFDLAHVIAPDPDDSGAALGVAIGILRPDAHLIANAPAWLAELLAENEKLRGDLAGSARLVQMTSEEYLDTMTTRMVEVVNWYATRRHLADPDDRMHPSENLHTICSPYTFGVQQERYEERMRERGKTPKPWSTLPLCRLCERKAGR